MKQLATDDQQDKLMGEQLTAEFHEAVNGMSRVVRVGAMVMMLRARVDQLVQIGQATKKGVKGEGLKAWLEQYAPKVNRATAYRFEDVAKAVAQKYELPARVAKQLTFEQLVTADPNDLDPAALKAQTDLNGFVAGTSQKSWLDDFKEMGGRGGDTSGSRKKLSPEEEHKKFLDDAKNEFAGTFEGLDRLVDSGTWKAPSITDPMLDAALEVARDFVKQASAWRKLTKKEREAASHNGHEGHNGSEDA